MIPRLSNEQVQLAMTYISRVQQDRDYRLLSREQRYDRMAEMVTAHLNDDLIRPDLGAGNLIAIRDYFEIKAIES